MAGPWTTALALLALELVAACRAVESGRPARRGEELSIAGVLVPIGTRVVLWYDEGGYSAYRTQPYFSATGPTGLRYRPGRQGLERGASELASSQAVDLAGVRALVDQFVVHYDACGTSRSCFRVLHDERQLSVHFLLDLDGTLYQTLDLADTGWHARQANARSVGVEIAQIGCFAPDAAQRLDAWYTQDAEGTRITLPASVGDGGIRTPDFVARPARPGRIQGEVHGRPLVQYDYTEQQYQALARLTAGLTQALPRLSLRVPRAADGALLQRALSPAELEGFSGLLGHLHITEEKTDPGPAFDWERLLREARGLIPLAQPALAETAPGKSCAPSSDPRAP